MNPVVAGPYDANSIMNYCNPSWNNSGVLSSGDIKAARQYYGTSTQTADKRDAVNWAINYVFEKGTKAYLFSGVNYERYDMPLDKVDSGYPLPIVGYWPGVMF